MAAKKKTKKQLRAKSKKSAGKKKTSTRIKKTTRKRAVKRVAPRNSATKKKAARKKPVAKKAVSAPKRKPPTKDRRPDSAVFAPDELTRSRSGGQSGDLQGLSDVESADSESVDELIEEGNAFEADVISGVEAAGDADEREVHTHEVPEDDVPDEYLDKE
jgi:hypothetical protein